MLCVNWSSLRSTRWGVGSACGLPGVGARHAAIAATTLARPVLVHAASSLPHTLVLQTSGCIWRDRIVAACSPHATLLWRPKRQWRVVLLSLATTLVLAVLAIKSVPRYAAAVRAEAHRPRCPMHTAHWQWLGCAVPSAPVACMHVGTGRWRPRSRHPHTLPSPRPWRLSVWRSPKPTSISIAA